MPKYTANDVINAEAPNDLYDSLIVQCTEAEFKLSKKNDPQIVAKWEILGVRTKDNKIAREITRNGVTFVLAGLATLPTYFTLTKKALRFYRDFWCKATGKKESEFEVDTEAPDIAFLNKLAMSAIVKAVVTEKTKPLSDEDKEALIAAGQPVKGETVVDDEGNPKYNKFLQIDSWNRRFDGELPAF